MNKRWRPGIRWPRNLLGFEAFKNSKSYLPSTLIRIALALSFLAHGIVFGDKSPLRRASESVAVERRCTSV